MCKIKPYNETMNKCLNSILLRLDTYLLYEEIQKVALKLKELSHGIPSENIFDEINEQIIDIDSVAELHDTYINKILESNIIYLRNSNINGVECDIYVNMYFIAFKITPNGREDIEYLVSQILTGLSELSLSIIFSYLRLNYSIHDKTSDEIWEICDKTAFPIMDGERYTGQYTDTTERNGVYIDLSRTITPTTEPNKKYDVNIQTKAILSTKNINDISEKIHNVITVSKEEVSRCFKA